jgi:hypothetical protein
LRCVGLGWVALRCVALRWHCGHVGTAAYQAKLLPSKRLGKNRGVSDTLGVPT